MNHLDLFSGIGGFHLAGEMVWGDEFNTISHVEIDPFCQKVLKKHWPEVPIISDIKEYKHNGTTIDLLTGGVPCQPASCAGKQRGAKDDRWLWPETFRVIREVKSTWCILENVKGLLAFEQGVVFESLLVELETIGYETEAFIIPACAQNAPHRRDRVWIVANSRRAYGEGIENGRKFERQIFDTKNAIMSQRSVGNDGKRNTSNSNRLNSNNAGYDSSEISQFKKAEVCGLHSSSDSKITKRQCAGRTWTRWKGFTNDNSPIANSHNERLQRSERSETHEKEETSHGSAPECNSAWNEPWLEVAQRLCGVSHGVSDRLVRYSLTLPETNGIIGFILMLRRFHYATSKEARSREVLSMLQQAFKEKTVQRCFGGLSEVFTTEDLRCPVHGKNDGEREKNKIGISERSDEAPEEELREMRNGQADKHPSYRRGLDEQCTCEFDDIVFELSHEITLGEWKGNAKKAENFLYDMWQESRGERFLHEPLQALHEIWRSVTDQEIGAFRRHLNKRDQHRVQKLKALGNAIVPQAVVPIMQAIKQIEYHGG